MISKNYSSQNHSSFDLLSVNKDLHQKFISKVIFKVKKNIVEPIQF
tara:strand:- start:144 stop:281 length:138 start_codon:yes stop_codon:yes gene_type:complete